MLPGIVSRVPDGISGPARRAAFGGYGWCLAALLDGADAHDPFRELGMLPQQFAFERVTLVMSHSNGDASSVSPCSDFVMPATS